jgi:hypothetical protein
MDIDEKNPIVWALFGGDVLRERIKIKENELSVLRKKLAKFEKVGVGKRLRKNQLEHDNDMSKLMELCHDLEFSQKDVIIEYYKQKHMLNGHSKTASQRYAEGKYKSAKRALDRYRKQYKDAALKISNDAT